MGQVQFTGTTNSYFVQNDIYPIAAVSPGVGQIGAAYFAVLDKNGGLRTIQSDDANFTILDLYVPVKVI